ncbi:MAG: 2OG-Fe(II) oxygenase family protein [Pseudolabrys sp.]
MAGEPSDGVERLWPTVMLRRTLPGADVANKVLAELVLGLEAGNAELTTDYRADNLLVADHPAIQWLRDCINRTVMEYFRELGIGYQVDWTVHGWANVNRLGDYHDPHNHPHCYLSGTYYVQVPTDRAPLRSRKDVRPGCITFYDPRGPAVNMGAIRGDPYVNPEHTIQPKPGDILLWPAFMTHFVHPNLSETPRISISFNVMLKWSDAYLPRQE